MKCEQSLRRRSKQRVAFSGLMLLLAATGCSHSHSHFGESGERLNRLGDEIVVCGQYFHTGAPVVLWTDRGGYDAYRAECKWSPGETLPIGRNASDSPQRYHTLRKHVPEDVKADVTSNGWDLPMLKEYVDLFVLHYDVCGTSKKCFEVLHDRRGLSVHFMLDVDGTIYQTLDLKERAWHAGSANNRSVGVEIANIGAYSPKKTETLERWYDKDASGRTILTLPKRMGDGGVRTADYIAYPARNEPVRGTVQGRELLQYDLTDAQYESLIRLTATLHKVLPKIALDYPRNEDGDLKTSILTDEEVDAFGGIIGHYHVSKRKVDPGPAFDWDRLIAGARQVLR